MQTPEEFAWTLYAEEMDFHDHSWYDTDATVRLIAARDEAIRADERGRCSIVHATLSDEALVAELVRRGVLRENVVGTPAVRSNRWVTDFRRRYVTEWEADDD